MVRTLSGQDHDAKLTSDLFRPELPWVAVVGLPEVV